MSQQSVERILGRIVTDEGFRRRFWKDRDRAMGDFSGWGCGFNDCERRALHALEREPVERFVETIDPRIQRIQNSGLEGDPE